MDTAPPAQPRPPDRNDLGAAWSHPAQLAMAFLLGVAAALLVVRMVSSTRWPTRPTEYERAATVVYRIDLNEAARAELLQLPGVGDSLAARIEDYRREHGAFRSVDELVEVRGVGPATLERLRPWVRVRQAGVADEDPSPPARKRAATTGKKEAQLTGRIDVNRAGAQELQRLPGIGPKLAERIVERRSREPFRTVEDLRRVSGIGPKILDRLRPHVTVGSDLAQAPVD